VRHHHVDASCLNAVTQLVYVLRLDKTVLFWTDCCEAPPYLSAQIGRVCSFFHVTRGDRRRLEAIVGDRSAPQIFSYLTS
jgi:hypothetical protein